MEPYADRSDLEAFALTGDAKPVVWLRDWTEVFLIQVQGSARVRLEDGSEIRLVYAGRNGHPYTSIGRILIDSGAIPQTAMTLDALKSWISRTDRLVIKPGDALCSATPPTSSSAPKPRGQARPGRRVVQACP